MSIKPVQNDDLLHLARIEKELFEEDAFGVFLLYHYLENHLVFDKILNDNALVGFGIVTQFNSAVLNPHEMEHVGKLLDKNKKIAHLVDFAIRKAFWNQGYGTALLQHFMITLIEKRYDFLYLEVDSSNTRAQQFYKSNEFHEIGSIKSYYSTGHDAILMLKQLERFS